MCRILTVGCVAALLFGVSGCGSNADSIAKDMISAMNDFAEGIQKKDDAKIKAAQERMKELDEKFKKLSAEEQNEAKQKYKKDIDEAGQRLVAAMKSNPEALFKNLGGLPGMPTMPGDMPDPSKMFPGGGGRLPEMPKLPGGAGLPDFPKPPAGGPELPKPPTGAPELPKLPQ